MVIIMGALFFMLFTIFFYPYMLLKIASHVLACFYCAHATKTEQPLSIDANNQNLLYETNRVSQTTFHYG